MTVAGAFIVGAIIAGALIAGVISPEHLLRSICRGAIVAFSGANMVGAIVAGAYVGSPSPTVSVRK